MAKTSNKTLPKDIVLPKGTRLIDNGKFMQSTHLEQTYSIIIGIGRDHTAELIISAEALQKLKNITSIKL